MGQLQDLTQMMAQAVVCNPDQISVKKVQGTSMIVLELTVAPEDVGRVIGKNGRVADAMRTLLRTSAAKDGKRINLEIL